MNELTAINLNEIKSPELKKDLSVMIKSITGIRKSTWQYALAIENIVSRETFKTDFETLDKFAKFINLSKATISQYCNAVKGKEMLTNSAAFAQSGWKLDNISIGKAYVCSIFSATELESFLTFLKSNEIELDVCSDKTLKKGYMMYKESIMEGEENGTDSEENSGIGTTEEEKKEASEADKENGKNSNKKPYITAKVIDIAVLDGHMCDVRINFEIHIPGGDTLYAQEVLQTKSLYALSNDNPSLVKELENSLGFVEIRE